MTILDDAEIIDLIEHKSFLCRNPKPEKYYEFSYSFQVKEPVRKIPLVCTFPIEVEDVEVTEDSSLS